MQVTPKNNMNPRLDLANNLLAQEVVVDDDNDDNDLRLAFVMNANKRKMMFADREEYDPEFLLRCASTHNWDILINFCALLVGIFKYESHDEARVLASRKQLVATDQWGNTSLTSACYHRPPLRVVTSILEAASASSVPIQIHLVKARDGSTALQVACACGASTEVIRALLGTQYPLVDGGRMVTVSDAQGGTPLSDLCLYYESERESPLYRGNVALDDIHTNFLTTNRDSSNNSSTNNADESPMADSNSGDSSLLSSTLFSSFWEKVECLLRAAWIAERSNSCYSTTKGKTCNDVPLFASILHGSAAVAESCPKVLIELICRCYPAAAAASFRCQDGSTDNEPLLPLHLALSTKYSAAQRRRQQQQRSTMHQQVLAERRSHFVRRLLELDHVAARTLLPPVAVVVQGEIVKRRRTPLCQAIASGLHWHHRRDHRHRADGTTAGPLQLLSSVVPEHLTERDAITGQFPFVLAASASSTTCCGKAEMDWGITAATGDVGQTDTVYSLLRLYPQLLEISRKKSTGN